jgi:hypothetical protein
MRKGFNDAIRGYSETKTRKQKQRLPLPKSVRTNTLMEYYLRSSGPRNTLKTRVAGRCFLASKQPGSNTILDREIRSPYSFLFLLCVAGLILVLLLFVIWSLLRSLFYQQVSVSSLFAALKDATHLATKLLWN